MKIRSERAKFLFLYKNYFPLSYGARECFFFIFYFKVRVWRCERYFFHSLCWNEKKFLFLEEGSPEKKMSYTSAMMVVLTDKLTL